MKTPGTRTSTPHPIWSLPILTGDGEFVAEYSAHGLCGLSFPRNSLRKRAAQDTAEIPREVHDWHAMTAKALTRALAGRDPGNLPPLDLSAGTPFQQRVWHAMREIGRGKTSRYGQLAQAIGRPKAVRAVGGACGANPIPVFVPCHRVLAANHRIGGFSSGLKWKELLLAREGVLLSLTH
jgi:O-6-methylguanine DNA methyltransferase